MSQELFIASGTRRDYLSGIMLLTAVGLSVTGLYFWSKLDAFKNSAEEELANLAKKIKTLEEITEKQAENQKVLQKELADEKSINAELQQKIDKLYSEKNNSLELKFQSLEAKLNEPPKTVIPAIEVKSSHVQPRVRSASMGGPSNFYKSLPEIPEKQDSPQKNNEQKTDPANTRLKRSASLSYPAPVARSRDQGNEPTRESDQMRLSSALSEARAAAVNRTQQYIYCNPENLEALEVLEELLCGYNDSFSTTYQKIKQKSFSTVNDLLVRFETCKNLPDKPHFKGAAYAKSIIASVIKNNLYLKVNEKTKQYFAVDNHISQNPTSEQPKQFSLRQSH